LKQDKYDPSEAIKQTLVPSKKSWAYLITIGSRVTGSLKEPTKGDAKGDVGSNTTLYCKRKDLNRCSPTRIAVQTEIDIAELEE
jgi:hypothetical protein